MSNSVQLTPPVVNLAVPGTIGATTPGVVNGTQFNINNRGVMSGVNGVGVYMPNGFGLVPSTSAGAIATNLYNLGAPDNRWNTVYIGTALNLTSNPPASATATGTTGTIAWDANYLYVCAATNTWKRVGISTW